jgi:Flp pilus assembly protein TadG
LASRDVALSEPEVSRRSFWARFSRDRRGAVAVAVAVLLPVLVGFAGIGIEVGLWFAIQRQNQSAADAAAISAGLEYAAQIESGVATNPTAAAATTANYNLFSTTPPNTLTLYPCYGYTVGSSCNTSPSNGPLDAVQVVLTRPLNTTFANFVTAIWGPNVNTVKVTTTAIAAFPAGTACFLALDPTAPNAVLVDNNGTLSNPNCWVASNSSSGSALSCNSCTIAGPTNVVGGDAVFNNGHLNGSPNRTSASAIPDPYAGVAVGNIPPSCSVVNGNSIKPGHYCNGIQLNNGGTLGMDPGVYYIDNVFSIQNGSTLNANGATIVINGSYAIQVGNSTLNIIAQSNGPFVGIAIFGPSAWQVKQEFGADSHINIQGAIYFPHQAIHFDSGSQFNSSYCTQIIGMQIHIENNANVSASCDGTGVASIPILKVYLTNYET